MSRQPVKCDTALMGRIFGHKWYYSVPFADCSYSTDFCTRCGWVPTS